MSLGPTPRLCRASCMVTKVRPAARVTGLIRRVSRVLPALGSPSRKALGMVRSPGASTVKAQRWPLTMKAISKAPAAAGSAPLREETVVTRLLPPPRGRQIPRRRVYHHRLERGNRADQMIEAAGRRGLLREDPVGRALVA